jgi:aminoglycoside phosphotransferase (APT) family kinase protein
MKAPPRTPAACSPVNPPDEATLLLAAADLARCLGLGAVQPTVIGRFSNLAVALSPTPWVLRIATGTATMRPEAHWTERELQLGRTLHAAGAPVAAPAPRGWGGPHWVAGCRSSLWQRVTVRPEPPEPEAAGAALADCHRALREAAPEALPHAPPWGALDELQQLLQRPELPHHVPAPDLVLVQRLTARCLCALRGIDADLQWLHGDAHLNNVVATPAGPCWLDWEDAQRAPLAWDLASLVAAARVLGSHAEWSEAALQGWQRRAGPVDKPLLAWCILARTLYVVAWTWHLGPQDAARQPRLQGRLAWLRRQS